MEKNFSISGIISNYIKNFDLLQDARQRYAELKEKRGKLSTPQSTDIVQRNFEIINGLKQVNEEIDNINTLLDGDEKLIVSIFKLTGVTFGAKIRWPFSDMTYYDVWFDENEKVNFNGPISHS